MVENVLFIMADQLRWDHLGCTGHPYLRTRNIDALARRGVRFTNAFATSGVCGPSRMSYYTGRYAISHGATWNRVPLNPGEITVGDYLQGAGVELALIGKSHVVPRVGSSNALLAASRTCGGFLEVERYDGHQPPGPESTYPSFLRDRGYQSTDPWTDYVIAVEDSSRMVRSGWQMRNVCWPSRVRSEHSESAFVTERAMSYIERMGSRPWALHLSYVKPHWPYVAPAPYHNLYKASQCLPVVRTWTELERAHRVLTAYRDHEESCSFQIDECIRTVRPVYQGLIHQLDDCLGMLFDLLERKRLFERTLIIFSSDHGDLLGDHWLGEKELFYDVVQKVPLIVVSPDPAADRVRGCTLDELVESVDVLPTVLDYLGIAGHNVEGRSLKPLLEDKRPPWRTCAFSELDYSFRQARVTLGKHPQEARGFSMRTKRWRYVYWVGEREQLYDLSQDSDELCDLGSDRAFDAIRDELRADLLKFLASRRPSVETDDEFVELHTNVHHNAGVHFGVW